MLNIYWERECVHFPINLCLYLCFTQVSTDDGPVIPAVNIPLTPRQCMHESFQNASKNIKLGGNFTESCVAEVESCGGILCNLTFPGAVFGSCITIDPCDETLHLVLKNSGNEIEFDRVFNHSQVANIGSHLGVTITLHVNLVRHNYSMDVEVSMSTHGGILWS